MLGIQIIAIVARGLQVLTGILILIFSLVYLSKSNQGLLLTLNSIAAIQVIFELGFSSVVLQYIAHERAHLSCTADFQIHGDGERLESLRAIFNIADKWFTCASIFCAITLAIGGYYFFKDVTTTDWMLPLVMLAVVVPLSLYQQKYWVTLEGLGLVDQVVWYRAISYFISCLMIPVFFVSGIGLYAPLINFFFITLISLFLKRKTKAVWVVISERMIAQNKKTKTLSKIIFKNMLLLQGRVAVSYMAGYFMFQAITPITYRTASAEIAAVVGLGVSVILILTNILTALVQVRVPFLIKAIQQKKLIDYYAAGDKIIAATVIVGLLMAILGGSLLIVLKYLDNVGMAGRLPDLHTYAYFVGAGIVAQIISVQATLTRLFKAEPYLWYSIVIAMMMMIASLEGANAHSADKIGMLSLAVMFCIALPWSTIIYQKDRKRRLNADGVHSNI